MEEHRERKNRDKGKNFRDKRSCGIGCAIDHSYGTDLKWSTY